MSYSYILQHFLFCLCLQFLSVSISLFFLIYHTKLLTLNQCACKYPTRNRKYFTAQHLHKMLLSPYLDYRLCETFAFVFFCPTWILLLGVYRFGVRNQLCIISLNSLYEFIRFPQFWVKADCTPPNSSSDCIQLCILSYTFQALLYWP